ncbi:MAG: hypothetical protein JXB30_14195 [Anaerolineae bacterium]|nr:hypothetical protein [Anaerolineae bacterium]
MREGAVFTHNTDLQRLYDDIVKTAEIAELPQINEDAIHNVLDVYQDFFTGSAISMRTSTKPKDRRGVNVRYFEHEVLHDPFRVAVDAGLIKKNGHPVMELLPELQARFPMSGYGGYGVDFGVEYGFEKIWSFFDGAQPIEEVYKIPCLPDGLKAYTDYFARYDLKDIRLFGVDYRNKSTNIYFFATDLAKPLTVDTVSSMIEDIGFKVPSQELLEHCTKGVPIYYTFTWDSPDVQRLCFCTHALEDQVPTHLDPLVERYVEEVPILSQHRLFIYNITMVRDSDFIKIEHDYTGTVGRQMQRAAQT